MKITVIKRTVETLCRQTTESMQRILSGSLIKPINRSGIISKLGLKVNYTSDHVIIETQFPDYAAYVDNGRRPGKRPPVQSLLSWCNSHLGSPKTKEDAKRSREQRVKNFAFLLARKIGRKGIVGKHFTTPLNRMIEMLSRAIKTDIVNEINNEINAETNKIK